MSPDQTKTPEPTIWIEREIFDGLRDDEDGCDAYTDGQTVANFAFSESAIGLFTAEQLATAVNERDLLIRDLRRELNVRRYGRGGA